ncbi:MAG: hypothetical protein GYB68_12130 [Chloroflexi bacterium]|nr:hypothetical protein [Chloroflexota bacterium]
MTDVTSYRIEIKGPFDEADLNAMSPLRMTVMRSALESTLVTACTDQAGVLGLLRYLNGRGITFFSVQRQSTS